MSRALVISLTAATALCAYAVTQLPPADPPSALEPPPSSGMSAAELEDWRAQLPETDGFDWPVGPPLAVGYYDAQPFGVNAHLGEDWNGLGGGDTDLGDPVYAIAHGRVRAAEDAGGGWGKVVRVLHRVEGEPAGVVESLYAHLQEMEVAPGDLVLRGQRIGRIGDADGLYMAHLHFELRAHPWLPLGPGYSRDAAGWTSPSAFIEARRPGGDPRRQDARRDDPR